MGTSTKLTIDSKESVKREYNILSEAIYKKKNLLSEKYIAMSFKNYYYYLLVEVSSSFGGTNNVFRRF